MINKKLNQGKVLLKLLVVLKVVVEQAVFEADLLKDVVVKGDVNKLLLKVLLLQAFLLEDLSQATSAKLKLVKVEAVQCKGGLEALVCKAMLKAPP